MIEDNRREILATKAEIDQWIASQGGPDAVVHSYDDIEVPDPRGVRGHPDYAFEFKNKKVTTRRETWTNKTTKASYSAARVPFADDQFTDIKETPATAAAASAATQKPPGGSETIEGTPDASKPGGFDNERPRWVTRDRNGTQIWTRPLEADEEKRWRDDRERSRNQGGKTDADIKAEQAAAETRAARPGTKISSRTAVKDGKTVTVETWRLPDGTTEERIDEKPAEIPKEEILHGRGPNGEDVRVIRDPSNGRVVRYEPIEGGKAPEQPDPTGAPTPSFTVGDAAKDLQAYGQWLYQQIGTGPGKITVARADALWEQRRKLWDVALTEQQGIVNTQSSEANRQTTQRGQTLQDLGNRRTSATNIATTAAGSLYPYMDKMGANASGEDFLAALRYARNSAQDFVTGTGANRQVSDVVPGPALAAVNAMPLQGQAPAGFLGVARPNAIGLGAVGNQAAPGAVAVPSGGPPAIPMTPERTRSIMQNPVFRPQAPVNVTPAAVPGMPSSVGDTGAPPVSMQAPPGFLSAMRPGVPQYDPTPSIQGMIADPSWDNAYVAQAARELYGIELPEVA